ncbi:probable peptidyl-tRNA hydrolase 2 [Saccostrea cucullata]|uniref:probable peptidyl-tRNA hydrolase 2 n=1 Tax=Saccostrea cuccullata TaxID=36930 RepID=UPI002ED17FA6
MDSGSDGAFQPNEDIVNILTSLGFSRNASIKALYYTGNSNADLAAAWVIENQHRSDIDSPLNEDESDDHGDEAGYLPEGVDFYKMVFVVNSELDMGVGKTAAQVAHAALGLHRTLLDDPQKYGQMLMSWEQFGETKIVTKGDNTAQLMSLAEKASNLDLPHYIVHDAGKTQIPSGSTTVLAIMGNLEVVDSITGSLKLL